MLDKEKTAEEISDILDLEPLPLEGGMWTQTFKDKNSTAIYYLLSKNNFSVISYGTLDNWIRFSSRWWHLD